MQPADIARLVTPGDPRVSPDGRRVAFVVTRVDLDADRYRSGIWLVPADGTGPPRALTAGAENDAHPRGRRTGGASRSRGRRRDPTRGTGWCSCPSTAPESP
ncbi:hypothetical protein [Actinomycetospora atypica]|uniref:Uncharacterized protein n=1 Tax=Actinomycetospora atypica TaxID=1290095 RepID=A0ABV9YPD4_9PSEU